MARSRLGAVNADALKLKGETTKLVDLNAQDVAARLSGRAQSLYQLVAGCQSMPTLCASFRAGQRRVPSILAELKAYATARKVPKGDLIIGYGYDDTVMPNGSC